MQPEDVLPGDIDANLGCPWIPESDIRDFAAQLFGVEPESIQVGHLKKDAVWTLDAGYAAKHPSPPRPNTAPTAPTAPGSWSWR